MDQTHAIPIKKGDQYMYLVEEVVDIDSVDVVMWART